MALCFKRDTQSIYNYIPIVVGVRRTHNKGHKEMRPKVSILHFP